MKRVLRYYGKADGLEERIRAFSDNAGEFYIISNCLDNAIFFENIEKSDFYDICDLLENGVYNDADISLEETLVSFLTANNLIVSVAESCTGGLVSNAIVSVPGASKVFFEGIVSYSNDAKESRLNVRHDTLMEFGAVSYQVAREMAVGLLDDNIDIAVSITGIAGPAGGSDTKPVGTVFIGVASHGRETESYAFRFSGGREQIRKCARNSALFCLLEHAKINF